VSIYTVPETLGRAEYVFPLSLILISLKLLFAPFTFSIDKFLCYHKSWIVFELNTDLSSSLMGKAEQVSQLLIGFAQFSKL
jgi:hypothetical protein